MDDDLDDKKQFQLNILLQLKDKDLKFLNNAISSSKINTNIKVQPKTNPRTGVKTFMVTDLTTGKKEELDKDPRIIL